MKINYLCQISGAYEWRPYKNAYFFFSKFDIRKYDLFANELWHVDRGGGIIHFFEDYLYVTDGSTTLQICTQTGRVIKEHTQWHLRVGTNDSERLAIVQMTDISPITIGAIDFSQHQLLWNRPLSIMGYGIFRDKLVWRKHKDYFTISCADIMSGQDIWQFDVSAFGTYNDRYDRNLEKKYKINNILCIWENQLFLSCANSNIISLDLETGRMLKRWEEMPVVSSENTNETGAAETIHYSMFEPSCLSLDSERKKLAGVYGFIYQGIDLVTHKAFSHSLETQLKGQGLELAESGLKMLGMNNTHYFLKGLSFIRPGTDYRNIALIALNKDSFEIETLDWLTKDNIGTPDSWGVSFISAADQHLIIKDVENRYRIYELGSS